MNQQYDYIVVGAGTAGSIVAARLSENPDTSVLLVEAGGTDRLPIITMPGALPFVYQNKHIQWGHQSGPEPHLDGKVIDEKAGKVIGGSSSINAMIFNRGNPMDYDGWAEDGLKDWDFAHCLPYFRKMESFEDGADDWRGGDGPVRITRARAEHKLYEAFIMAGAEAGHELTADHNGYRQEGMHIAQSFIFNGERWSSPRAYLRPVSERANLTILKRTMVRRIVLRHGSAVGIEVVRRGRTSTIHCGREVIVSAGAINTPKLLMLSGIGDPRHLTEHGIVTKADVPQVGRNLQNHPGVDIQFSAEAKDSLVSEIGPWGRAKLSVDWVARRRGLGTTNFFEAGAFLRVRDDVDFPNMQYEFLPLTRQLRKGKLVPVPGFQFWVDLSRPESRGSVRLRSSDLGAAPLTVFNTYESQRDLDDMVLAVHQARELVAQPSLAKYCTGELNPGPHVRTDAEIAAWIRQATGTSYHPSGTCRMGVDDDAVVDGEGRVKAVPGLRVVDASIMPKVITGNLNAPVMMMAEKIADRIKGVPALAASTAGYYKHPAQAR